MSTFVLVHLVHVISAILGGGLVAGVAIVAARATPPATGLLLRLTRGASVGVGATFLSGIALDFSGSGTFHETGWFRAAGISMVVLGMLLGLLRRRVRQVASGTAEQTALRPVPWLAYAACGVLVWITMLMELQPF